MSWLLLAEACSDRSTKTSYLKQGAAALCDRKLPLLVTSRPDGSYELNSGVMDSAQLVHSLHVLLPPLSSRLVMVRLDAARGTQLRWIVSAIEREGGEAYVPDTACFPLPPGAKRPVFPR